MINYIFKVAILVLIVPLLTLGCTVKNKNSIVDRQVSTTLAEKLDQSTVGINKSIETVKKVDEEAKDIITKSTEIDAQVSNLLENVGSFAFNEGFDVREFRSTTSELTQQIRLNSNNIINHSESLEKELEQVLKNYDALYKVIPQIETYETRISDITLEKQKIENKAKQDTLYTYTAFGALGMLTLIVGAFIAFRDQKLGLKIVAVGAIAMAISLIVIQTFADWRWIGLGLIVISLITAITLIIRKFAIVQKANTENMKVIDTLKPLLPEADKKILFEEGIEGVPAVRAIQSDSTVREFEEYKKKTEGNNGSKSS